MFEVKQKPEVVVGKVSNVKNMFIQQAIAKGNETRSGNLSKKFSSSGDTFVDQFAKGGKYKEPRKFSEIAKDAEMLWGEDPLKAVKFTLFLRTIPRTVNLPDGTKTQVPQKGTELKHEAIMRMLWLHGKSPESFWNNILLFVSLGSWHDVFTMLQYDLSYNGWNNRQLDWNKFGDLILAGLNNKYTVDLVKKYLPQIKSRSQATTIDAQSNNAIAKWICSLLFGNKEGPSTYKMYRKLKNSGTAHDWQKLISQSKFNEIDFNAIHGRALSILVKSKFLKNHGLSDKYAAWITAPTTKEVKYTGFVHELFEGSWKNDKNKEATINKQFETLVEKARTNEVTDLIVVRDTSGSMGSQCPGTKSTCYDVAKALALYFSEFLKGRFAGHWIEFNSTAKLQKWVGQTPTDKWNNDHSSFVGSTNFQSVVDLFCQMRSQGVPEEDFPSGILAISDGEFDKTQLDDTNVEAARKKLRNHFSKEYADNFIIVLWNLQNRYYGSGSGEKFETGVNTRGCYYFGGYSGSVISFLNDGKIMTTYELMEQALNQEVLNMVEL